MSETREYMRRNLDNVRMSIRRQPKTPYEFVFGAYAYALKRFDEETALLLKAHLRCVDEGGECDLCRERLATKNALTVKEAA